VLVVDDEPVAVSFVARGLRGRGFDVDVAGGGGDALAKAGARRYDVVLLDPRMPGTNAVTVLSQLRELHPNESTVVVSAAADTRIRVRCLELGPRTSSRSRPSSSRASPPMRGARVRAAPRTTGTFASGVGTRPASPHGRPASGRA
jgi:CheY-like chemotaxis protein